MKNSHALLRILPFVLLCPLASGCFFYGTTRSAGMRRERPAVEDDVRGPVLKVYAHSNPPRLAIKYRVAIDATDFLFGITAHEIGKSERWLNLSRWSIRRVLPFHHPALNIGDRPVRLRKEEGKNIFFLPATFVQGLVSRRPSWDLSDFEEIEIAAIDENYDLAGKRVLGVHVFLVPEDPKLVALGKRQWPGVRGAFVMDFSQTKELDIVVFPFPRRRYRTGWGKAAQFLVPVAIAADVVTLPVQVIVAR